MDKVYITPEDWALGDDERKFVVRGNEHEPDWFYVETNDGKWIALHKEEVELLWQFAQDGSGEAVKNVKD